jgi:hypothetical protein
VPGADELAAGGLDGVGGPVVLAGLPDDRGSVVLAAAVHGHPDPQGEGGLAVLDVAVTVGVVLVGGHPEVGVEPVEGLLGGPLGRPVVVVVDPVAMVELVSEVGIALGPGPDLGMLDRQVGDGVAVLPVLWIEFERLGRQLAMV